jgi:hypothetical protein
MCECLGEIWGWGLLEDDKLILTGLVGGRGRLVASGSGYEEAVLANPPESNLQSRVLIGRSRCKCCP